MNKFSNYFIIILISLSIFTSGAYLKNKNIESTTTSNSYKEKLIRFHILANSDSVEDQELKLKVRDKVIDSMEEKFAKSESLDETREILNENMDNMRQVALKEIEENGKGYDVEIKLEDHEFPTKSYGKFTLPAGKYEAIRVLIGEAKGENWWCVMFPPLCFVDSKNAVADSETDKKMKKYLTSEEYSEISSGEANKMQLKSKLLEMIRRL